MKPYDKILDILLKGYIEILGDIMTGFYVHGSIALGSFSSENSDIDFIVTVNERLGFSDKLKIVKLCDSVTPLAPKKGIEMSIVQERYAREIVYPTPYELHFSEFYRDTVNSNPSAICGDEGKTDVDLAAHFVVIRRSGITLYSTPAREMFGPVRREYYLDSVLADIKAEDDEIVAAPQSYILNICRTIAYLSSDLILSKRHGGEYMLGKTEYDDIILAAIMFYTHSKPFLIEKERILAFCRYAYGVIDDKLALGGGEYV